MCCKFLDSSLVQVASSDIWKLGDLAIFEDSKAICGLGCNGSSMVLLFAQNRLNCHTVVTLFEFFEEKLGQIHLEVFGIEVYNTWLSFFLSFSLCNCVKK